ncbi:MAG: ABC transporter substrate binding protein [Pseudomonadota bacterium]
MNHNFKTLFAMSSLLVSVLLFSSAASSGASKCLYVSSYHQGYAWSDGVEQGLRKVLTGHCEIRQIDMDTKRNKSVEFKQAAAADVKREIENWKPDVVIVSDDNAAKYVVKQYYRDAATPFVFSGVNWTVKEYGFPYTNVTGIVEVAPLEAMLSQAMKHSSGSNKAIYLGADTLTEKKNLERVSGMSERLGIELEGVLVANADDWKKAYLEAQNADFIVMGSYSGISGWNKDELADFAVTHAKKLTVTSHDWMMPFSTIGFTKIPQEHGEWAAQTAIEILKGRSPDEIPIVANRDWDLWLNASHLESTQIKLPRKLMRKAKKVN